MGRKSDVGLIHRFTYPPYQLRAVTNEELIVCGGGGGSKTGIPNSIEVLRLEQPSDTSNASQLLPTVRVVGEVDTSPNAVMALDVVSASTYFSVIAARGSQCQEYGVRRLAEANGTVSDGSGGTHRHRGGAIHADIRTQGTGLLSGESTEFVLEPLNNVSNPDAVTINVIKFSKCGTKFATGSSDGRVRIYDAQTMELLLETQAHGPEPKYEVDGLDAAPNWSKLCTVGGCDKFVRLWRTTDLTQVIELTLPCATSVPYKFRHCVFGRVEGGTGDPDSQCALYTTHTALRRSSKHSPPSYLVAWDCVKYRAKHVINTGAEILSSISVSDEGRYVAVGTIEGSVSVYISFSMQRLYRLAQAHNVFVTAVEFLPAARALRSQQDFELLSASADNLLRLHRVPQRSSYSCLLPLAGAALLVWLFFYVIVELQL